ncbi:uncharacterized protein LOC115454581 [Manduca sexta]|uniref:uncharacterized protein LOC115454581 n=1 Tax=Manduca sexta TaxID=7130 RepID=UPI001184395D|nr:uncharacterized protein LOC115454581 [Manduca sexta]KAG6438910.1 hypothetical protein O3G_MSEX000321 [Manduca sexta]
MGINEDNLHASLAHLVLCCVAGRGISRMHGKSFTDPGMHANFFIHGVLGFLHFQSGMFNNDFRAAYVISYKASRYLALPCLMADLYRSNQALSAIHLVSGIVPFALALAGEDNISLGNLVIACNIISLCYYSLENNREWGWYTAGAGVFAYFIAPQKSSIMMYPLGLALMEYCAYRVFGIVFESL